MLLKKIQGNFQFLPIDLTANSFEDAQHQSLLERVSNMNNPKSTFNIDM